MSYKVPFIDYPTHYHRSKDEIDAAIKEVLSLEGMEFFNKEM